MGRRSINTTKSGKYMNPTDQARKEARKRELKKNKKQRQMVRAAVLKGKDPLQLINDMEKIDEMEYNVNAPPLLNEKVLKDKRKKLKETWDRVMRLYFKEDRERFNELKKLELEYEAKRSILVKYFESVRIAQQVQVDEIPLPDTPEIPLFLTSQIPLPSEMEIMPEIDTTIIPHSILKKTPVFSQQPESYTSSLRAPGIPPGPVPDLSSDEEENDDDALNEEDNESTIQDKFGKSRKIRFADEKEAQHLKTTDFEDERDKEKDKHVEYMDTPEEISDDTERPKLEDIPIPPVPHSTPLPPGPPPRPQGLPQGPPPNVSVMFRPPPLRAGIPPPPRMLPPGVPPPPPGRPTLPPPGLPIRLGAPPIRLPPGPPPGLPPPRLLRPPTAPPPRLPSTTTTSSVLPPGTNATTTAAPASNITVLSAPPSLMQRPKVLASEEEAQRSATIEAKPQIRNLSADVMRFMPTTLRVKREDRQKKGLSKNGPTFEPKDNYPSTTPVANPSISAPTKDDAYQQFLREMEELL
ncbi:WW domain-binding protein 11-like [Uloborus diversus]|uniref:WW domain-binding protein 11-like n=1 Tax=Uloborus diversus TaxID=327109 RepID=UPI0024092B07|nr:WW domain-binding protein 11-like [Uloborus diversus]